MNKENKEAKPSFSSRNRTYIDYPVRYYADNQDENPFLAKKGPRDFIDGKKLCTQVIRTEYRYHNDLDVYSPSVITEINDPLDVLVESYLLDIILDLMKFAGFICFLKEILKVFIRVKLWQ